MVDMKITFHTNFSELKRAIRRLPGKQFWEAKLLPFFFEFMPAVATLVILPRSLQLVDRCFLAMRAYLHRLFDRVVYHLCPDRVHFHYSSG